MSTSQPDQDIEGTHAKNTARCGPRAVPNRAPTNAELAEDWARELLAGLPVTATTAYRLMAAQTYATLAVGYRLAELTQAAGDTRDELTYLRGELEALRCGGIAGIEVVLP